jgi:hypothetical protein
MRGDLSTRFRGPDVNFNGVLFQQGRVFLDRDGNAQTAITTDWEDTAGRDMIGAGILAVPGDDPESFRVEQANLAGQTVTLTVHPGHAWADGMLVRLDEDPPIMRVATPLGPPLQTPANAPGAGDRDAVVLEVWRHEVHGFQLPDELVEPALGGVDTTERLATGMAFRLFRMDPDDSCEIVAGKVNDDPSTKGKLSVTLQPTVVIAGDCPTIEGGGYTGFEHSLFRIEIAETTGGPRMFKWSQFNGGLVGRGMFDAATLRATITANLAPIATSDLTDFYLETVEWDAARGIWAVTYGAKVSLVGDELVLPAAPTIGAIPAAGQTVFFRLWNDIRPLSDFLVSANPTELVDGIRLEFEADATGRYAAEDYWTFEVRAGDIGNATTLIDNEPPEGLVYRRVPVAVLDWDGTNTLSPDTGTIEDCRDVFQPLTRLTTCCTYRVGDGLVSHGQFTSIQAAIDALPPEGGNVCVLPGTFLETVLIDGRRNVAVSGCGRRTHVAAPPNDGDPVFHVLNSTGITLEHLAIEADEDEAGILLEAGGVSAGEGDDVPHTGLLDDIVLDDLFVRAARRSAIEVEDGSNVLIENCIVWMEDRATPWPGIFFIGLDSRIERNVVIVVDSDRRAPTPGVRLSAEEGLGGVQLGGGCERVVVLDNLIQGGVGNGITLGSIRTYDEITRTWVVVGWLININDPCEPGDTSIPPDESGGDHGPRYQSDGPLFDIRIQDNRILDMGLNGIGVVGFFDLEKTREIVSVYGLRISENEIRRCVQRTIAPIRRSFNETLGYGGIALADVSLLEIRENIIEDNGPDYLEPVCGIFVLHGAGVEIIENRIVDNGIPTAEPVGDAKPGPRGGIYIARCTPPLDVWRPSELAVSRDRAAIVASLGGTALGTAALRVHANRVIAPLGRAVTATTIGDVSVHGNHFTSLGVERAEGRTSTQITTVQLADLGRGGTEYVGTGSSYSAVSYGRRSVDETEYAYVGAGTYGRSEDEPSQESLYLFPWLERGGRVLFADNQVALLVADGGDDGGAISLASIGIRTLGDIGFHDNQCSVKIARGGMLTNLFAFAVSLRVEGNLFEEGLPNAIYSAITLGVMNMTMADQAVHCLLIRGWPNLVVDQPNTVLVQAVNPAFCRQYGEVLGSFGLVKERG